MTPEYAKQFGLGVFRFFWTDGGSSVGVIGNNSAGYRWYAVSNWLSGESYAWSHVDRVELIERQHAKQR